MQGTNQLINEAERWIRSAKLEARQDGDYDATCRLSDALEALAQAKELTLETRLNRQYNEYLRNFKR